MRREAGFIFTALVGLVGRNRRRYGGYIVHLGIVLAFLGFAGDGFKREEQVLLRPGQQSTVGRFTVRHNSVDVTDDGQKQMITGHVTLLEDGKEVDRMYPAKWFYRHHESEPTTEVAIRRGFAQDVYIVMPAFAPKDQSASYHIVINPLVDDPGSGCARDGTGIALRPERAAAAVSPPSRLTTTTLPWCFTADRARATRQPDRGPGIQIVAEKAMQRS